MTSVSAESNDPDRCPRPSKDRDGGGVCGGGGGGSGPSSTESAMSSHRRRADTVSGMSASQSPWTSWPSSPRNRSTWRVFTFATTTRICPEDRRPCCHASEVSGRARASREVLRSWVASPWDMRSRTRIQELIDTDRSEEHTSELQSLMSNSYAVFCLKKKKTTK